MALTLTPVRHEVQALDWGDTVFDCPIELTLTVLGGKWKAVILWQLLRHPTLRFSELARLIPGLTPRMLTRQLRELEDHGVLYRDVFPVVPPRVEYGLTDRGRSLGPALDLLCQWGKANR